MLPISINNNRVKYSFEEEIDDGMSSLVYRVFFSGNEYALKLFNRNIPDSYFQNELRICRELCTEENPDFIRYISSSEDDHICNANYIVFELAKKGTLEDFITYEIPFTENNVKIIFWKLAKMVKLMHILGFCHRDLKPGNIFVDQNFHLKLGDFGSAKYFLNQNGESVLLYDKAGTLEYMAPEVRNKFPYDGEKVDIYSLGVILLYLRTGKQLSEKGKDLSTDITQESFWKKIELEKENLPQNFKDLVTSMLVKNYQNRPDIDTILNNSYFDEIRNPNNFQEGYNAFRDKLREIDNYNKVEF